MDELRNVSERVYEKYDRAIGRAGAELARGAVRLLVSLALDDQRAAFEGILHATEQRRRFDDAVHQVSQRQYAWLNDQVSRLNEWLAEHAPDLYQEPETDTAQAMIAAADRLRGTVMRVGREMEVVSDERTQALQRLQAQLTPLRVWLAAAHPEYAILTPDERLGEQVVRVAGEERKRADHLYGLLNGVNGEVVQLRHEVSAAITARDEAEAAAAQFRDEADQVQEDFNLALAREQALIVERDGLRGQKDEIERIMRVLAAHDAALHEDVSAGRTQLATAIDALASSYTAALQAVAERTLDADNAKLAQELAAARAHSTGVGDFGIADYAPDAAPQATADGAASDGLVWDGDLADWAEGLEKGRHDWRKLLRPVRWQLIANVVRQIPASESASTAWFDAHRPGWMTSARAAALTFGDGRWERVLAMVRSGEVVRR